MSQSAVPATLAVSTYLKAGFTPAAIATDSQGNVYLAGSAVIDATSGATSAVVMKVDPKATQYLYVTYLDSAASDQVSGIAVDGVGNAYVVGWTTNPNFPQVGGSALGEAPASNSDTRSFVIKLSPQGAVMFSTLIGGSAMSTARGVALTPQGQILVSGLAGSSGFPTTAGAYTVADSKGHWFLTELDATASQVIFSSTGIGGSSIALDTAGNIYVAGSSAGTDYPTTPGAYQTTFVQGFICYGLCQIGFPGGLQHVTKIDRTGSKLIYSTGVNDPQGRAGSTTNTGLAVDTTGNAYLTGTLLQALYPFTIPVSGNASGYLTKLDSSGANLIYSVPAGGGGVKLDDAGYVLVGGTVSSYSPLALVSTTPVAPTPVFSWIPQPCLPNNIVGISDAYVMKVDGATGEVRDAQWIDGSAPGATGIALTGGRAWITGATPAPDVPFSPGVLAARDIGPGELAGAYLSAVDFSDAKEANPAIACVLDAGNLTHVGVVAGFQLLTIFGANLHGASVTFDGRPAQVLYDSPTQINVAVPAAVPPAGTGPLPDTTVMEIGGNGARVQRQFPFTTSNLNLFADLSSNQVRCDQANFIANGFQPVAANADGSMNSCTSPARYGSTVSLFVHGVGGLAPPPQLLNLQAYVGLCSAAVTNATLVNDYVYKVDVKLPDSPLPCADAYSSMQAEGQFPVTLSYRGVPVGPVVVPTGGPIINFGPGSPMPMIVWVH